MKIAQRLLILLLVLPFAGLFLTGCLKKIPEPAFQETKIVPDPIQQFLGAFSIAESLEAKASIRIDTVRNGEKLSFALNGVLLYQKPNYLRLMGYHPFGMGIFDALFKNGSFFLLIPIQKKAYEGEVREIEGMADRAGPIQIATEKDEVNGIPKRIQIELLEKETRIDLRLKEARINSPLPADSFQWIVPEGVEVRPLNRLLKGKSFR